jgi:hypothetical protein
MVGCKIIVYTTHYCILYVSYCSGDDVATMYSYDLLLILDLWWDARSLYVQLIIASNMFCIAQVMLLQLFIRMAASNS